MKLLQRTKRGELKLLAEGISVVGTRDVDAVALKWLPKDDDQSFEMQIPTNDVGLRALGQMIQVFISLYFIGTPLPRRNRLTLVGDLEWQRRTQEHADAKAAADWLHALAEQIVRSKPPPG